MTIHLKLLVLGSGGVGKSSITIQFVHGVFVDKYHPAIEDPYRKSVEYNGNQYMLEILDTSRTEQFVAMRDLYTKIGHGFILIYSVISRASFNAVPEIRDQLQRVKEDKIPLVLVGNKCDLDNDQRMTSTQQGQSLANKFGCPYIEASAKAPTNVDEIFYTLLEQISLFSSTQHNIDKGWSRCQLL